MKHARCKDLNSYNPDPLFGKNRTGGSWQK